jgi:hypothetical protein
LGWRASLTQETGDVIKGFFFFIATELKVMIFGAIGATNIHSALKRILEKVRQQNFKLFRSHSDSGKALSGRAVCHRFRTLTPCPNRAACWMASKNGRRRKVGG